MSRELPFVGASLEVIRTRRKFGPSPIYVDDLDVFTKHSNKGLDTALPILNIVLLSLVYVTVERGTIPLFYAKMHRYPFSA